MTSLMMSSPWKRFFGIIWDDLFISEVKLKLWLIHQNFQNGRHFELAKNFYRKLYRKLNIPLYYFQNLTYFVTWWRHQWRHEYTFLYKCGHNLMIPMHRKFNDDIFARFLVIMKNVVISLIKEYSVPNFMAPRDVIDDVITMKKIFWHNLGRSFHIWSQIEAVFNISKFSKWPPFWARDKLFCRKLYRKLNIPER